MDSISIPVNNNHKVSHSNAGSNELSRAVKCFGRNVYKIAVAIPYTLYHAFSLGTEGLFAASGAVVGAVRGGTVKLVRAIGSKLDLCHKSTKPISEYVIKDFHRGANVGWIPGKIVGVLGSAVTSAGIFLCPISLAVSGTLIGTYSIAEGISAYKDIKKTGYSTAEHDSKNILKYIAKEYKDKHDFLYGKKHRKNI